MTDYAKEIKVSLIRKGKTKKWLIAKIMEETGLYCDYAYLSKIENGERKAPKITAAINNILGITKEGIE